MEIDNSNKITDAWQTICSFEHLLAAHKEASKGKRYRHEVMTFSDRLEDNLFNIQRKMKDGTYRIGPYRKIWVYVPKKRLVMALPYPDRVVQWSIYMYINPIYDKLFIEDSYACRKNKGGEKAILRLQYWMKKVSRQPGEEWYTLKLDISKYFYRINHKILLQILSKRIEDPDLMKFIQKIVDGAAQPFGLPPGKSPQETPAEEWRNDVGIPIGNLTSQLFANIYLNELDQYCKHTLHCRYYIRYMDDVVILGHKQELAKIKEKIETFLHERLELDLNKKTSIKPVRQGVEFVGVRIWTTHMKIRKSTIRRKKRTVKGISRKYATGKLTKEELIRRVASVNGSMKNVECESLRWRLNQIFINELKKESGKEEQREPSANHRSTGKCDGAAG